MKSINEYFRNATLHSLHFISRSRLHWTEKFFWIICVIGCWFGCFQIMLNSYSQFQHKAISFTVDTNYLSYNTSFPSIVFCEKSNPHLKQFAAKWSAINDTIKLQNVLKEIAFYSGLVPMYPFQKCAQTPGERCITSNFTYYAREIRNSTTCPHLFMHCSWNSKVFKCCDYVALMETPLGPCFAINSLATKSSSKKRKKKHISMEMSMDVKEGRLSIEMAHTDILILVMSTEEIPSFSTDINKLIPFDLQKNIEYNTYLTVRDMNNEPQVWNVDVENRGCRFPQENYLWTSKIYSYSACVLQCQAEHMRQKCNCIHHLIPYAKKSDLCDLEGLKCFNENFKTLISTSYCKCLPSCIQMEIKKIGFLMYDISPNSDTVKDKLKHPESVLRVNVNIPMATHRYVRKIVNGVMDVIGSVAALFLGASLLSIVEFFYFILIRPATNFCMRKRRENKTVARSKKKVTFSNRVNVDEEYVPQKLFHRVIFIQPKLRM